jgi:DNA-binding CsgD family transcriptional regulator
MARAFQREAETDAQPQKARDVPGSSWVMLAGNPFRKLSCREREIACSVSQGRSNKEIARALGISPWTVSSHLRQIFAKLGISRRIELCMLWHRASGQG